MAGENHFDTAVDELARERNGTEDIVATATAGQKDTLRGDQSVEGGCRNHRLSIEERRAIGTRGWLPDPMDEPVQGQGAMAAGTGDREVR